MFTHFFGHALQLLAVVGYDLVAFFIGASYVRETALELGPGLAELLLAGSLAALYLVVLHCQDFDFLF